MGGAAGVAAVGSLMDEHDRAELTRALEAIDRLHAELGKIEDVLHGLAARHDALEVEGREVFTVPYQYQELKDVPAVEWRERTLWW